MTPDTTLLLVGHGSRGSTGNADTLRFLAQWREHHPAWRITLCFIEHADLLLDAGLDQAAQDARQVRVIPFILNAAGHVKMDVPVAVAAARQRHPSVEFVVMPPLGIGRELLSVLQKQLDRLMQELAQPDPQTTGVLLLGRGSSDVDANGEMARMARWLFEDNNHELDDLAFTGVTWPRLETVVQRQVKLGMQQIVILPVYLFNGVLFERIQTQLARLQSQYPQIALASGTPLAFEPEIFTLLDTRADASQQHTHTHGHA